MLQCLNKKDKMIENNTLYIIRVKYALENNTLYKILVKYALFCCAVPEAFTEDKEAPDVLYKDGLNMGNKH